MKYLTTGVLMLLLASGCIPTKPEPPDESAPTSAEPTSGDQQAVLTDELIALLNDPDSNRMNARTYQLREQLPMMSPTALAPIVELLGKAETSDDTRVFILQTINIYMTEAYLPSIEKLLDSEYPVVRSCATILLGPIQSPEAVALLHRMKADPSDGVSFSAWSGLAEHGIEPHRSELINFYTSPEVIEAQRAEIIRVILIDPKLEDLPVLSLAVNAGETSLPFRMAIASVLGEIGTLDSVDSLEKSIVQTDSADYRALAESAIALIQERNNA